MKNCFSFVVALCACLLAPGAGAVEVEAHAAAFAADILTEVAKLKAADPMAVPMAFWDFDGTIIKGDVSVGRPNGEDDNLLYKGLVQRTIEAGLVSCYDPQTGWTKFWTEDYPRLNQFGRWISWPFLAQVLAGNETAKLDDFCHAEYEKTYRHWYFAASYRMLRTLEEAGVENYIISASPELYVRNADRTLGLPTSRFRGIRTKTVGGRVTTDVITPLPAGRRARP